MNKVNHIARIILTLIQLMTTQFSLLTDEENTCHLYKLPAPPLENLSIHAIYCDSYASQVTFNSQNTSLLIEKKAKEFLLAELQRNMENIMIQSFFVTVENLDTEGQSFKGPLSVCPLNLLVHHLHLQSLTFACAKVY